MVQHIYIQFTLLRKTGKSQIAAPKIANSGIYGIFTEQKIKLSV